MIRISPLDLSFLLLERPNRPFHMAAMTISKNRRDSSLLWAAPI